MEGMSGIISMQTRIISGKLYEASIGKGFANKDVNEMVNIFNKTISNALNNHIPQETLICDNQDPPWIKNEVKKAIQKKNQLFSRVKSNVSNGTLLKKLQCLQNKLNDLIRTTKWQYGNTIHEYVRN